MLCLKGGNGVSLKRSIHSPNWSPPQLSSLKRPSGKKKEKTLAQTRRFVPGLGGPTERLRPWPRGPQPMVRYPFCAAGRKIFDGIHRVFKQQFKVAELLVRSYLLMAHSLAALMAAETQNRQAGDATRMQHATQLRHATRMQHLRNTDATLDGRHGC